MNFKEFTSIWISWSMFWGTALGFMGIEGNSFKFGDFDESVDDFNIF